MRAARRRTIWSALIVLLSFPFPSLSQSAPGKPLEIKLAPYGIPRGLFASNRPFTCLHAHPAWAKIFWIDADHIFVAFTTNPPCTFGSSSDPVNLRAIVFDTAGSKVASHDWPLAENMSFFPAPGHTVAIRQGNRLQFLDNRLEVTEVGQFEESPKHLWVTPYRRTIPLLTRDGVTFEFYTADPLKLLSTISLDQSSEIKSVLQWTPGDERIAGSRCLDKSPFSCNKIIVATPDANFIRPDGAPWSYEETEKPVSLSPVGFLDPTHLVISRLYKGFFHAEELLVVTSAGARIQLPRIDFGFDPRDIIGVAHDGARFALELDKEGMCDDCIVAKAFVVVDSDAKKFLFERVGSAYFSGGELSPDGKRMAILDDNKVILYPLP